MSKYGCQAGCIKRSASPLRLQALTEVILATGIQPREDPDIAGYRSSQVVSYIYIHPQATNRWVQGGGVGAGGIALDVSEYITMLHRAATRAWIAGILFWKEWGIDLNIEARGGNQAASRHSDEFSSPAARECF